MSNRYETFIIDFEIFGVKQQNEQQNVQEGNPYQAGGY